MSDIDELVDRESEPGKSPHAVAREVCRSLTFDTPLRNLLESLLSDQNRASFERYLILQDVRVIDEELALAVELRSFDRVNKRPVRSFDDIKSGKVWS